MNSKMQDRLKERLKGLKERGGLAHLWRPPKDGTSTVRIVPYKHDKDGIPFLEYYYHYNISDKPITCPKNTFGNPCPICELVSAYWKGSEDDKKIAKSWGARTRIHIPVLVRGEEDRGVRFYSCGTQVYESLLNYLMDPDYENMLDPEEGNDIKISVTPPTDNNPFPKTDVRVRPKSTPLAATKSEIKELVDGVQDFSELVEILSEKELKELLLKLAGEDSDSNEEDTDLGDEWSKEDDDDDNDDGLDDV